MNPKYVLTKSQNLQFLEYLWMNSPPPYSLYITASSAWRQFTYPFKGHILEVFINISQKLTKNFTSILLTGTFTFCSCTILNFVIYNSKYWSLIFIFRYLRTKWFLSLLSLPPKRNWKHQLTKIPQPGDTGQIRTL